FYLLRIFKWPETVILATIGIPTICLVLLLFLPFVDLRTERRLSRRPVAVVAAILTVVAMGTLTYKGATAQEAIAAEVKAAVPGWAKKQGFQNNKDALDGANLFAESGCTNCHTYLGAGSANLGAPDLSAEGTKGHSVSYFVAKMKCPSCVTHGSPMPPFGALGPKNLRLLAQFLAASKRGGEVHVFLGITGASGAPYAARLLESLADAGCEIGLCASRAGVEVLATELYGDARLSPDETLARLTAP